jgi:hypothetical protein
MLANPALTINPGTDLLGGGQVSLGGSTTLNLDTTKVPQLGTANTFIGNQTVNGNLSATGVVTGSSYQIGSNLFDYGSYANGNAFLGFAGNGTMTGTKNTATGYEALSSNLTGNGNTASGYQALLLNTSGKNNTATGFGALNQNTSGSFNTAYGVGALSNNTTGHDNTVIGSAALYNSTSGGLITAIGDTALLNNTTGSSNTAVGAGSGNPVDNSFLTANNDTFLGANSAVSTGTITNATAIGANAEVDESNAMVLGSINGVNGATASTSVGIGTTTPAAMLDVHGTGNFTGLITFAAGQTFPGTGTITGVTAGTDLTGGGGSGNVTLNVDTTKVVTGVVAGTDLTGGGTGGLLRLNLDTTKVPLLTANNTFTGNQTVNGNLSATGVVTGSSYQIGSNLFAFGSYANFNAFLGFAGNTTMTGTANTASGYGALFFNTTGVSNTASGYGALFSNTTGNYNSASGLDALYSNTTGNDNTASGLGALYYNTTGSGNTATGLDALYGNTGSYNTASGEQALYFNTTGSGNTSAGDWALQYNTTGGANTAIGALSGLTTDRSYMTGSSNTFLGYNTSPSTGTLNNATAIGAYAEVDANNSLVLGSINGVNGAAANTLVGIGTTAPTYLLHIGNQGGSSYNNFLRVEGPASGSGNAISVGGHGDVGIDAYGVPNGRFVVKDSGLVGIGTSSPDTLLSVNGGADKPGGGSWGTFSDRRLKTLNGNFTSGLEQILKLKPVRYRYKDDNALGIHDPQEHVGLVAQEVQRVIPEAVTENGKGYLLVNNDPILWAMLNAIQEQQGQIREQKEQIHNQQEQIRAQQAQIRAQQVRSKLEQAEITRLSSQIQVIQTSLSGNGRTSSEIRPVKATMSVAKQ